MTPHEAQALDVIREIECCIDRDGELYDEARAIAVMLAALQAARAEERETCATIAENHHPCGDAIASDIRHAGGTT